MKILSWNCQGLGNPGTVRALSLLLKSERPDFVFLMDTRMTSDRFDGIRRKVGYKNGFAVNCVGFSGGLGVLWNEDIDASLNNFSKIHVDFQIDCGDGSGVWHLTGLYGVAEVCRRTETWKLLRDLKSLSDSPWMCLGDFNEILCNSEKEGGNVRAEWQMRNFREALVDCELYDLGFEGLIYTWDKKSPDDAHIRCRLDRAVASACWQDKFANSKVTHLPPSYSDHVPILVDTDFKGACTRKPYLFRFEPMWLRQGDCSNVVEEAWFHSGRDGTAMNALLDKLEGASEGLKVWNKNSFGNINRQIKELQNLLKKCNEEQQTTTSLAKGNQLRNELDEILLREEIMWKQRSRADWLGATGGNTKFFHARANQRRKKNRIKRLKRDDGTWAESDEQVEVEVLKYFAKLFQSSNPSDMEIDQVLESVEPSITPEMNDDLIREFSKEEVEAALSQMHPLKAPGPDGFSALFYQKFWKTVGPVVSKAVLDFLNKGLFDDRVNFTQVVLIPKRKNPESMAHFRPISLCSVFYKIISKVLANRLKGVLPHVISDTQSAFVPGRLITDNVLVAFEINHFLKNKRRTPKKKRRGQDGYMSVKLDMSKAYDRVEWRFLEKMMWKMGFSEVWISRIMKCVSSVSYSYLLNGERKGCVKPERGLRQGDPLSPYLFLLCAEGLSSLIRKAQGEGVINGIKVARNSPEISHLFFADDSLLCVQASVPQLDAVLQILNVYEKASGQQINREKTVVNFSANVSAPVRASLLQRLGARGEGPLEKYLGMPAIVGRSKKQIFGFLKDRVSSRINGWKEKFLSTDGREVMIKAVAQAIPTYIMSCFKIPKGLCKELNSMVSNFWWGQKENEHRIRWVNWNSMCRSKFEGGLGFRHLENSNDAMLAKQGWRLIHHQDSLVYKVLKGKYFPRTSFMEAKCFATASATWKSILGSRWLLEKGLRWRIGDGSKIKIWQDSWLPRESCGKVTSPPKSLPPDARVRDLLIPGGRQWNRPLIDAIFDVGEASLIKSIPLSCVAREDSQFWPLQKNGVYTVKSAYHLITSCHEANRASSSKNISANVNFSWKMLWKLRIPERIKVFVWRAVKGVLPTCLNLSRKKVQCDPMCTTCESGEEDDLHCIRDCPISRQVWLISPLGLRSDASSSNTVGEWINETQQKLDKEQTALFFILAWCIWNNRNFARFKKSKSSAMEIVQRAVSLWDELISGSILRKAKKIVWKKPRNGSVKINVDAAVFGGGGWGSTSAVIRDANGIVLAAKMTRIDHVLDVETSETLAVLKGMMFAAELGFKNVELEGDAKNVMEAINAGLCPLSTVGSLFGDIFDFQSCFDSFSASFVPREANFVAHILTREVFKSSDSIWVDSEPLSISSYVTADLAS